MKPRTEDDARAQSRRQAARAFIAENGPLPEQPPLESRACAHAGSSRACSCHLTLAQIAVAEELGDYTLYVFGMPYTGRVKVPFYPGASAGDSTHIAAPVASLPEQVPVAPAVPASVSGASRPKRAFDPIYNTAYAKARRRGAEAVAAFKAEWAAKKAAA